jgi:hypothetical protein
MVFSERCIDRLKKECKSYLYMQIKRFFPFRPYGKIYPQCIYQMH